MFCRMADEEPASSKSFPINDFTTSHFNDTCCWKTNSNTINHGCNSWRRRGDSTGLVTLRPSCPLIFLLEAAFRPSCPLTWHPETTSWAPARTGFLSISQFSETSQRNVGKEVWQSGEKIYFIKNCQKYTLSKNWQKKRIVSRSGCAVENF